MDAETTLNRITRTVERGEGISCADAQLLLDRLAELASAREIVKEYIAIGPIEEFRILHDAARGASQVPTSAPPLIEDSSGGTHLSPESAAEFERIARTHAQVPTSATTDVEAEASLFVQWFAEIGISIPHAAARNFLAELDAWRATSQGGADG